MRISLAIVGILVVAFFSPVRAMSQSVTPTAQAFSPFINALREWNEIRRRFEDHRRSQRTTHAYQPINLNTLISAGDRVIAEWSKLSASERQHEFADRIDSIRLVQARALADLGRYREALEKLNAEVSYQYTRETKTYLGWRGSYEFQELVCLEADILGNIGRTAHLENPDHFIAPIRIAGDERDAFVAMERTTADEVKSIAIPPLPSGEEREILYLLRVGSDGTYQVVAKKQFIGRNGSRSKIEVQEGTGGGVILRRVTHEVVIHQDIPVKDVPARYLPLRNDTVKLQVIPNGFRTVEPSEPSIPLDATPTGKSSWNRSLGDGFAEKAPCPTRFFAWTSEKLQRATVVESIRIGSGGAA